MTLLRKDWTPEAADHWTWHDLFACLFGVFAFILIALGVAGALLLQPWGFVALVLAVFFAWLTFTVIDPKLRALSDAFDDKQAGYLESVEKRNRWENEHGD